MLISLLNSQKEMKINNTLLLVVGCLLVSMARAEEGDNMPTWQNQCKMHCTHNHNTVKTVALNAGCERFRYTLPRPTVYRICKTAFDKAIQEHCPGACGVEDKSHPTHKAANHCAQHKETVPKPDAWEACKQGYRHGDRAATEFARSVKALHEESKDEL